MPNMPAGPSACGRMWQWKAQAPGLRHSITASQRSPGLTPRVSQVKAALPKGEPSRATMRLAHVRARGLRHEFVRKGLAGHDRLLRHERHAVHGVGDLLAVEVDAGRLIEVVAERGAHLVALDDPQQRPRPGLVEADGLDRRLARIDLPVEGGAVPP